MKKVPTQNMSHLRETTLHGNAMFPLMLYDISPDTSFEERIGCHWHEEIEFLVITKGNALIHLGGAVYPVQENSICIILSDQLHLLTCERYQRLDFFAIVFHMDFLRSMSSDIIQKKYLETCLANGAASRVICPAEAWEKQLLQCLCDIRAAFHAKEYAYELFIKIRLLEALHLLVTNIAHDQDTAENDFDHRVVTVKSMMEYLRRNYDSDITLEQLEKVFGLSKGHICRLFKSITYMTPFEYLNYYRINQSVDFLEHSDDEISLVATKSGFNNISYYNRTFRKYMHMTPSEYRRSCLRKEL
ncbi:MAG: AraC family transcriptional regulator [Lachnospiraceae bacterium]|nr:AraC family transcriptional regulator [Lachnospiraceae bacterium]